MCRGSGSMNRMQTGRGATLARTLALAVAAVVVLGGTGVVLWSRSSAGAASRGYQQKRQALATHRAAYSKAQSVDQDARTVHTSNQQVHPELAPAGQQLSPKSGGNLGAMQQAGNQAVFNANNGASVIASLTKEGPFKGADPVDRIS